MDAISLGVAIVAILIAIAAIVIAFVRGGKPGPEGPAGATGAQGPQGPPGTGTGSGGGGGGGGSTGFTFNRLTSTGNGNGSNINLPALANQYYYVTYGGGTLTSGSNLILQTDPNLTPGGQFIIDTSEASEGSVLSVGNSNYTLTNSGTLPLATGTVYTFYLLDDTTFTYTSTTGTWTGND